MQTPPWDRVIEGLGSLFFYNYTYLVFTHELVEIRCPVEDYLARQIDRLTRLNLQSLDDLTSQLAAYLFWCVSRLDERVFCAQIWYRNVFLCTRPLQSASQTWLREYLTYWCLVWASLTRLEDWKCSFLRLTGHQLSPLNLQIVRHGLVIAAQLLWPG